MYGQRQWVVDGPAKQVGHQNQCGPRHVLDQVAHDDLGAHHRHDNVHKVVVNREQLLYLRVLFCSKLYFHIGLFTLKFYLALKAALLEIYFFCGIEQFIYSPIHFWLKKEFVITFLKFHAFFKGTILWNNYFNKGNDEFY